MGLYTAEELGLSPATLQRIMSPLKKPEPDPTPIEMLEKFELTSISELQFKVLISEDLEKQVLEHGMSKKTLRQTQAYYIRLIKKQGFSIKPPEKPVEKQEEPVKPEKAPEPEVPKSCEIPKEIPQKVAEFIPRPIVKATVLTLPEKLPAPRHLSDPKPKIEHVPGGITIGPAFIWKTKKKGMLFYHGKNGTITWSDRPGGISRYEPKLDQTTHLNILEEERKDPSLAESNLPKGKELHFCAEPDVFFERGLL
jgi:hypothetical protein